MAQFRMCQHCPGAEAFPHLGRLRHHWWAVNDRGMPNVVSVGPGDTVRDVALDRKYGGVWGSLFFVSAKDRAGRDRREDAIELGLRKRVLMAVELLPRMESARPVVKAEAFLQKLAAMGDEEWREALKTAGLAWSDADAGWVARGRSPLPSHEGCTYFDIPCVTPPVGNTSFGAASLAQAAAHVSGPALRSPMFAAAERDGWEVLSEQDGKSETKDAQDDKEPDVASARFLAALKLEDFEDPDDALLDAADDTVKGRGKSQKSLNFGDSVKEQSPGPTMSAKAEDRPAASDDDASRQAAYKLDQLEARLRDFEVKYYDLVRRQPLAGVGSPIPTMPSAPEQHQRLVTMPDQDVGFKHRAGGANPCTVMAWVYMDTERSAPGEVNSDRRHTMGFAVQQTMLRWRFPVDYAQDVFGDSCRGNWLSLVAKKMRGS